VQNIREVKVFRGLYSIGSFLLTRWFPLPILSLIRVNRNPFCEGKSMPPRYFVTLIALATFKAEEAQGEIEF
jgi:hypothetical protein